MPQLSSKLRKKLVPFSIFHQLQTCCQVWGWYHISATYTIHYINDEWQLCNKCLQIQYLPQDHTGANLAEAMEAAMAIWDLDAANQICVTMDNGSNIISAARILDWLRLRFPASVTTYILLSPKLCKMIVDVAEHLECIGKL